MGVENKPKKQKQVTPTQTLPKKFSKQGGEDGVSYAGLYSRLSFSSRKTNLTNFLAVKASARLC